MSQGRDKEKDTVRQIFNDESKAIADSFHIDQINNDLIDYTINFLKMAHNQKLNLEMKALQNEIYPYIKMDLSKTKINKKKFDKMKNLLNFL